MKIIADLKYPNLKLINYLDHKKLKLICKDKKIVEKLVSKGIKRADLFNQKKV